MEVAAGIHADLHIEEATQQRSEGAGDDAERVDVDGGRGTEQTIRFQREDAPKETVVVHAFIPLHHLTRISGDVSTSFLLQIGPVRSPVVVATGRDLADDEDQHKYEQGEVATAIVQVLRVHLAGYVATCHHLAVQIVVHVIPVVDIGILCNSIEK